MQSKVIKYLGLYTEPAKNYNDLAKPDVTWAKKKPFKNSSYACAIATKALEHIPEPKIFQSEVFRIFKQDKVFFYISVLASFA